MADLSDEDIALHQRATRLLQVLNAHPEGRKHLEASLKAVDPKIKTTDETVHELVEPHLEVVKSLAEELKAEREARATERAEQKAADEQARYDAAFNRLRVNDGVTDEGEAAIRKLMVDRNIADPEAAFALFQKQNPVVEVTSASYEPQHWNFENNAVATDVDGLWKDPDRWADQETGRILTDMRKAPNQG